uniref:DUF5641 domain-containing protein n=1 Tax=Syphacia muris TaxID=451379 RepID=A0A0N5B1C0_9BILA
MEDRRIVEVIRNKKGKVTSATVRMPRKNLEAPVKYLTKPISRLYPLQLRSPETEERCKRSVADPNLQEEQPE